MVSAVLPIVVCIVFGVYIRREAILSGFFADDYAQLGMLDGSYPLERAPYDLYTFSNGTREEGTRLMRAGFYPWWADPSVRVSMFRPLASLMTDLEFHLWGSNARAYHLHSLFWWVAMTALVAVLYRRWLPPIAAIVALALYVCDEAHGISLGWICNRSAMVSVTLSLCALALHVSCRTAPSRWLRFGAIAGYTVALGFGEYALCMLGYFLAYEAVGSKERLGSRLRAVAPFMLCAVLYLLLRAASGMSMARSGLYADLSDPLALAKAVALRAPVLVADMVLALSADYWTWGAPLLQAGVSHGWLSERWLHDLSTWRALQTLLGVGACVAVALYARRMARSEEAPSTSWLGLGALLALVPVCGSFPSSRLTIAAAFGFMPAWVAFAASLARSKLRWPTAPILAACALLYHVVLPVGFERDESLRIAFLTRQTRTAIAHLDDEAPDLAHHDLVLLNAPEVGTSMYLPLTRLRYHQAPPRRCAYLSLAPAPYVLTRVADNAFTMRLSSSATILETPHEQLLRGASAPFHVGDVVDIGLFRVSVLDLLEGRPKTVRVEFDRPLEDPSLLFMVPTVHGYERYPLPPVGEAKVVKAPQFPSEAGVAHDRSASADLG